ncbi:hypothetical protein M0D69_02945 [Caballeronia sp. SEWSISQ10-4 2]|uniref:hypothetical protein n=1 Tax=Caballeronia sp. SEWSISQ10-4 2 TaxID=2937438 RepID=UPI00264AF0F3|nr:hypothetical protein [Caballeronia sp. SEWSISQ10-4 2]MDN7176991.1 hypothetical protein [Caballeronia sp. SEWSISQ10-4 2]
MHSRRARPSDPLARLFRDVTGEAPDEASLGRMRRVSNALNLRDNDALWSVLAVLEYYARLYEAMPDRIREAGEGSLDDVRAEAAEATEALMAQHRDALARCKATIQLAEAMIREHEERYRAALATLSEAGLNVLAERAANRIARTVGNRVVGAFSVAARDQRDRFDTAVQRFGQAVAEAGQQVDTAAQAMEQRFRRTVRNLLAGVLAVLLMAIIAGIGGGCWVISHASSDACHAGRLAGENRAISGWRASVEQGRGKQVGFRSVHEA